MITTACELAFTQNSYTKSPIMVLQVHQQSCPMDIPLGLCAGSPSASSVPVFPSAWMLSSVGSMSGPKQRTWSWWFQQAELHFLLRANRSVLTPSASPLIVSGCLEPGSHPHSICAHLMGKRSLSQTVAHLSDIHLSLSRDNTPKSNQPFEIGGNTQYSTCLTKQRQRKCVSGKSPCSAGARGTHNLHSKELTSLQVVA